MKTPAKQQKAVVFSGIQPSGQLHIGNYFGAVRSWLDLQANPKNDCTFAIVDYHALTEGPNPAVLQQRIFDVAVDFLACGLDPARSTIMLQSLVPEHTDLGWILNCATPVSWLERVPTFKDKAAQFRDNVNMGLLDYPVLMAADILLYHATAVPVGLDQLPHLELAREIARTFNAKYGPTFPEPKAVVTPTPKIMSLTDPTRKMSKSLGPKAYIALADSPAEIEAKVKAMPTAIGDEKEISGELIRRTAEISVEFKDLHADPSRSAAIHTEEDLASVRAKLGDQRYRTFMALYNFYMLLYIFAEAKDRRRFIDGLRQGTVQFSEYKKLLADKISNFPALVEFRRQHAALAKNPKKIEQVLKAGSLRAQRRARLNLLAVKKRVGLA